MKEQKKNKWSVVVAESAYNSENAQFGPVMKFSEPQKLTECMFWGNLFSSHRCRSSKKKSFFLERMFSLDKPTSVIEVAVFEKKLCALNFFVQD